ncbi:MAG: P-loop NTPase fold protein [Cyanobacteria bacterium P01_B01_bin.77]
MAVIVNSKVEANRAIEEQNPFAQPPFVHAKHVWGEQFPDIESLNAHASDAVFKALDEIRAGHYSTTSLLITAQNGTGKTHIISRIRHRLKQNGQALFVFANQFNDLNEVKEGFQKLLAGSLGYEGARKISQWQEVASKIASVSLEILKPGGTKISEKELIKKFTKNTHREGWGMDTEAWRHLLYGKRHKRSGNCQGYSLVSIRKSEISCR